MANFYGKYSSFGGAGGGGGVTSLNSLTGALSIVAGSNITVTPSGSNITISASSGLTFGNLTDVGTDGIVITGGTGAVIGSGTSIAQSVATGSQNGYLASTDWTTFNNKQTAGSYITALTGDVTASGPGSAVASLAATSNATLVTLSALTTAGSLATVGTISTGVWAATAVAIAHGGTGASSTSQNFAFIGPTSGSGAPSFRALVAGDIPSLSGTYLPLAGGALSGALTTSSTIALTLGHKIFFDSTTDGCWIGAGITDTADLTLSAESGYEVTLQVGGSDVASFNANEALVCPAGASIIPLGTTGGNVGARNSSLSTAIRPFTSFYANTSFRCLGGSTTHPSFQVYSGSDQTVDAGTGMFFPSTSAIAWAVGTTQNMQLTSTALLVGSSATPQNVLHVDHASGSGCSIQITNSVTGNSAANVGCLISASSSDLQINNRSTGDIIFFNSGGNTSATITSNHDLEVVGALSNGYQVVVATTSGSTTINNHVNNLILTPAGTIAAYTVTMPAAPNDGQWVTISSSQIITSLTVQANSGQTLDGTISSAAANSFASWIYVLSATTWYRAG